jgi:hypothetical protein
LLLGARLAILEAQQIQLMDAFMVSKSQGKNVHKNALDLPVTDKWFKTCQELMEEAKEAKLPRIFIAATLAFAKIARAATWSAKSEQNPTGAQESDHIETARTLLGDASFFCLSLGDSDVLTKRLEDMMELYEPRVEEVTPEELASIRSAMVTGPHGMATHSGHWYNCINGHPVSYFLLTLPGEPWLTSLFSLRLENAVCLWKRHDAPNVVLRSAVPTIELRMEFLELRIWRLLRMKYDVRERLRTRLSVDVLGNPSKLLVVNRWKKVVS